MNIALVHDDLVQWGGAERVLEGLTEIFPQASIFTSVFDRGNKNINRVFGSKKVYTSFLQNVPGWKSLYKILLPFYPIAFEQFDFSGFDLVISQTTRFAKSIITKPGTKHICYCHTPLRFLWHFSGEKNLGLVELLMSKLRIYDQVSARRVDLFLAGSENSKRRIKKIYQRDSRVLYPFVDLERFDKVESFDGGYFLVISRLNRYKKVDLAIKACLGLGLPLKVIGNGPDLEKLKGIGGDVEFFGNLGDEMVVKVLSGCKALIISGIEDFGLTSLEAQALGKPVIAFKAGGVIETVIDGKTGMLFNAQNVASLAGVLERFNLRKFNSLDCIENASRFSKKRFIKDIKQIVASV